MLKTHRHLNLSLEESVTHCNAMGDGWVWGASGLMFYDFSTGYSSLSYLQRLPTQVVKIDQSFVCDMLTDARDHALAQGIIGLALTFGRAPVAEGGGNHGPRRGAAPTGLRHSARLWPLAPPAPGRL